MKKKKSEKDKELIFSKKVWVLSFILGTIIFGIDIQTYGGAGGFFGYIGYILGAWVLIVIFITVCYIIKTIVLRIMKKITEKK